MPAFRAGAMIDEAVDAAEVLRDLVDHRGDALVVEHVVHIGVGTVAARMRRKNVFMRYSFNCAANIVCDGRAPRRKRKTLLRK